MSKLSQLKEELQELKDNPPTYSELFWQNVEKKAEVRLKRFKKCDKMMTISFKNLHVEFNL